MGQQCDRKGRRKNGDKVHAQQRALLQHFISHITVEADYLGRKFEHRRLTDIPNIDDIWRNIYKLDENSPAGPTQLLSVLQNLPRIHLRNTFCTTQ